jgi:hypothetical protein
MAVYVGMHSRGPLSIQKSSPVVLPVLTGLVPVRTTDRSVVQSFSWRIAAYKLTSLLVSSLVLGRVTPVVRVAGSTGLLVRCS